MWVVRDEDRKLYLCIDKKPFKNYYSPDQFRWFYTGTYMPIQIESDKFNNLKYTDEPVKVNIVPKK